MIFGREILMRPGQGPEGCL